MVINLVLFKYILDIYYTNILELLSGLILNAFINNIKYRLTGNIENINNNRIIKANIIS
jgi:hypothetical protein